MTCGWCEKPATSERTITPAVYRGEKLVRAAVTVGVCDQHAAIFERSDMIKACLEQRARVRRMLARPTQGNRDHLNARLEEINGELRELGHVDPVARRRAAR